MAVLETILAVIAALLLLCFLIVAHEFGHFMVGRWCGIRIEEFSIGFGPKLFSRKKKETQFSVRAIPVGGYVQFYGEDEEMVQEPRAFNNRPVWQRLLTVLGGPAMNFIVAILITVCVLMIFGEYRPVVSNVSMDFPAEQAGIQIGDRIVEINGKRIDFYSEFSTEELSKDQVSIKVERDGKELSFSLQPVPGTEGTKVVGIMINLEREHFGFFEALALSFKWLFLIIKEMLSFLGGLIFRGQGTGEVAGFVGTMDVVSQAVRMGAEVILRIAALLSINLGIMNLLPFPALDGGRAVFLIIEKITNKAIPRKVEGYINMIGFLIVIVLMLLLTVQDIGRLLR